MLSLTCLISFTALWSLAIPPKHFPESVHFENQHITHLILRNNWHLLNLSSPNRLLSNCVCNCICICTCLCLCLFIFKSPAFASFSLQLAEYLFVSSIRACHMCVCGQLNTAHQGTVDKKYSHLKAFAHVDVVDVEKCQLPCRSKAQEEKEKMHSFPLLS